MNYKILPKNYRYAGTMDFLRNRKQMRAVLRLSLALVVLPAVCGVIVAPIGDAWRFMLGRWWRWPALIAALVAYIPLHELTHGVVMYALSGVRPTYGLRLPYAYAGSTVWFDRRSHVITALAPVVLWGISFGALGLALPREWWWFLLILQISNLSGSAGDLYCAWFLARMEGDLLIQDTGVRMRIFKYNPPAEESNP